MLAIAGFGLTTIIFGYLWLIWHRENVSLVGFAMSWALSRCLPDALYLGACLML
jgi:hypothetical protein